MIKEVMKSRLLTFLVFILMALVPLKALAMQEIYTPDAQKGMLDVSFGAQKSKDDTDAILNDFKELQTSLSYGMTDSFGMGVESNAYNTGTNGDDFGYQITGLNLLYQFTEAGESSPLSTGIRAEYEKNHSGIDQANAALLFDYKGENFEYMINAGFYTEVGSDADQSLTGDVRVGVRYLLSDLFQPGVEYYNDTGEISADNDLTETTTSVGPVVYGSLTNNFYYQAGYLYGLSDDAADNSYKVNIGYKIDFDQ